jgi:aminoglycoside phosphotransferase (APT) family kinase protein
VTREPGPLLASGRDADIFEFGPDLVLRKTRGEGRSLEREARAMQFVADAGYPVPAIHELRAGGTELVMERVRGPLMSDAILRAVWRMPAYARMLADLHDQLHAIAAPDWLPQLDDGGGDLVHLDLHPLNVIMDPDRGPVVIDWANASRGQGLSDVALTYVLLTAPRMPGPAALRVVAQPIRQLLARQFTARWHGPALDARIAIAADMKAEDRNMDEQEVATLHALAQRMRQKQRK